MKSSIKLKIRLRCEEWQGKMFFPIFFITILMIAYQKKTLFILVAGLLLLIILFIYQRSLAILTIIIIIWTITLLTIYRYQYMKNAFGYYENTGQVVKIVEKKATKQITIKSKNIKLIGYLKKDQAISLGDIIYYQGTIEEAAPSHAPHLFDYRQYLYYQRIKGIIKIEQYQIIAKRKTIAGINNSIGNYYDNFFDEKSAAYLKALIIGNKDDIDKATIEDISQIGIGHLFVVSGLHVGLIVKMIAFLLDKLKVKKRYHLIVTVIFLLIYLIITNFLISVIRVFLSFIIRAINKKKRLPFTNFDLFAINCLLVLVVNPLQIYSISFILTYLISGMITLISPLLKGNRTIKSFIINNIIISSGSLLITLPIIIDINPRLNLLTIIYNIFYIPFVSYIMLPFSLIVTVLPFLGLVYRQLIQYFEIVTNFLATISFGTVTIPVMSLYLNIVYYACLGKILLMFQKERKLWRLVFLVISLILLVTNIKPANSFDEIYFLDLPVGEATLIRKAFNRANILIDTGEQGYDDLPLFLKKHGIKRLDFVFISHGDSDHIGGLKSLVQEFRITNIVYCKYDESSLAILEQLQGTKINLLGCQKGDQINYRKLIFEILMPDEVMNSCNNNSLVIKAEVFNKIILFTGDIEKAAEKRLMSYYKNLSVDILKVAHHGSKTSSSLEFLKWLQFQYAISMNGYQNTFGFPHPLIVARLMPYRHLSTQRYQTIIFRRKFWQKELKLANQN